MINFVGAIHIFGALLLIAVVLIQDSKDGAMGGMLGGGSSNSLLGATGATTFLEKLTRGLAVFFAATCIMLTVLTARQGKSLLDSYTPPAAAAPAAPGAPTAPVPATEGTTTPSTAGSGNAASETPAAATAAPAAPTTPEKK